MGDYNRRFVLKPLKTIDADGYDGVLLVYNKDHGNAEPRVAGVIERALRCDRVLEKEIAVLPVPELPAGRVVYSPTGPLDIDYDDVRSVREAAYAGTKRAIRAGIRKPIVLLQKHPHFENAELVTLLGVLEALYVPLQIRELKPSAVPSIDEIGVVSENEAETQRLIDLALQLNSGLILTKDIADADPERMSPPRVREHVEAAFKGSAIKVRVEAITNENYPLFEAVNRAADHIDRHRGLLVFLEYEPPNAAAVKDTLLIVGKGVTYDTGGADLKVDGCMAGMSRDKCGAAAVAGFMQIVRERAPNDLKVVGAMSLVRNSIGSNAYVADELIKARSGALVRVTNTDAEGRMVMADVLCALKDVAINSINPHLYTIATLTGHACLAVGDGYSIVMDNGPAKNVAHGQTLERSGHAIADPFEISTIRREDVAFHRGKSEFDDIMQCGARSSSKTCRGHQGPAGFLMLASGLDKHGSGGAVPLKYSHIDIAASSGALPERAVAAPILALANKYLLKL